MNLLHLLDNNEAQVAPQQDDEDVGTLFDSLIEVMYVLTAQVQALEDQVAKSSG
jgi:hypothetical protein